MARPDPRILEVIQVKQITPHMRRVTLGGAGLKSFPADQESAYLKMMFQSEVSDRPMLRTYTVRYQRNDEIDVDFVLHHDGGPAATWAATVKPGETIEVRGPGPKKLVDTSADWFFIVGDMTALPAISVNIESLPANAKGHAVIEVTEKEDIQEISTPEGFDIYWLVNPNPGKDNQMLISKIRSLPWQNGRPSVWAACEFSSMRQLREYFRNERQLDKIELYISSYWKHGIDEDAHKIAKRADA